MAGADRLNAAEISQLLGCHKATVYRAWSSGSLGLTTRRPKASTQQQVDAWKAGEPAISPDGDQRVSELMVELVALRERVRTADIELRRAQRRNASLRATLRDTLQRLASERSSSQVADRSVERLITDQAQDEDDEVRAP